MPFGGNDWLELTQEPTLEPGLPICDPHHHFWEFRSERIPYQKYLIHELADDINSGHNVRSTVFIEARSMYRTAGPDQIRPVGEVEFVQGIAAASASGIYGEGRAAAAIIGAANLDLGADVESVLEELQEASPNRFRGIRSHTGHDTHPEIESRAPAGRMASSNFRAGAQVLARKGLVMDITAYFHQAGEMADFARAVPDLPLIFNHIGGLLRVGPYANRDDEVLAQWRSSIDTVAECPNIYMKLGGVGQPRYGFDWHEWNQPVTSEALAGELGPLMNYCIEKFGPERCMFESNFPVDKVSYSYNVLFNAFKRLSSAYSSSERAALFHDTAVQVYGIDYR